MTRAWGKGESCCNRRRIFRCGRIGSFEEERVSAIKIRFGFLYFLCDRCLYLFIWGGGVRLEGIGIRVGARGNIGKKRVDLEGGRGSGVESLGVTVPK